MKHLTLATVVALAGLTSTANAAAPQEVLSIICADKSTDFRTALDYYARTRDATGFEAIMHFTVVDFDIDFVYELGLLERWLGSSPQERDRWIAQVHQGCIQAG